MSRERIVSGLERGHTLALGAWVGAVALTGAAAATVFPVMKSLEPALPGFAGYPRDHWAIAAGAPMNRVFLAADVAQAACAAIALACFAGAWAAGRPRLGVGLTARVALLAGAVGVLAWQMAVTRPSMQADLHAFHDAARRGDVETADARRAAFDAAHRPASNLLVGGMGLALAAGVAACVAPVRPRGERSA